MNSVIQIAKDVILEARRNHFYWLTVAIALILVALFSFFSQMTEEFRGKLYMETGFTVVWFIHFVLAILFTSESMYGEDERRSVYFYLSRNVSRQEYLLGKFLGTWVAVSVSLLISGAAFLGGCTYFLGFKFKILLGLFYIILEMGLTIALVILLSRVLSKILTTFVFLLLFFFSSLLEYLTISSAAPGFLKILFLFIPNYKYYSYIEMVVHAKEVSWLYFGFLLAYTLFLSGSYLLISSYQYEKKFL